MRKISFLFLLVFFSLYCSQSKNPIFTGVDSNFSIYFLNDSINVRKHTIKKTRFGEIMQGLRFGASYAFDEESYTRFYPFARKEGLNVKWVDFSKDKPEGMRFFTVQIVIL